MVKDIPISEIILRKYERPYDISRRDLVKKICLSLGLLQPGDSRDVVVDILQVLIDSRSSKEKLSSDEIKVKVEGLRRDSKLEIKGVAESNIRRQLKRLRDMMIIEKRENLYYLNEFETLDKIFEEKIERFIVRPNIERIREYLGELEK
tara:strand:+ start:2576 stop:3022 length:447 start_codon:yes stop_codon:yes gene_type:complete